MNGSEMPSTGQAAQERSDAPETAGKLSTGAMTLASVEQLEKALQTARRVGSYGKALKSTLYALIVVAAVSVLVSALVFPFLYITGSSMTPVVGDGDIVVALRTTNVQRGDVIAFYFNNKVLVKRVIAVGGETVEINTKGDIYINGEPLDEPYLTAKAWGDWSITKDNRYEVPVGKYFVVGDHRNTSRDSRHLEIGPVSEEQILGRLVLRVWPANEFGKID